MSAVGLALALLLSAAYPPPGETITVYQDACTVSYQQGTGTSSGAYAKFDPVSWASCTWGWNTRVTVTGVKGGITKVKTCFMGGPCASGSWWKAQHPAGVTFVYSDLRLCYPFYGVDVCQTFRFTS